MSLDTTKIIQACEGMWTASKRVQFSALRDDHRDAILSKFEALCTDLGKIATKTGRPDWLRVQIAVGELHSNAIADEEARSGTFTQIGAELRLVTSLHALAVNLGLWIEDAATAPACEAEPDDGLAMAAVEGIEVMRAAE